MTIKRGLIYGAILLCLATALWFLRRANHKEDTQITSTVLKPQEQEKLIFDPTRHTITTVNRTGPVRKTFLPPHPVSVSISIDGKVSVQERKGGTEASPFIGFAYSDKARIALGVDLLYWHRWEVGPVVLLGISGPLSLRVGLKGSYNLYSNTSLFVGMDSRGTPTGGISFKF